MKARVLGEPKLEFRAGNRHIDPRYGIAVYGPADADAPSAPHAIPVGLVGPPGAIESLHGWLERCQSRIEAKEAKPGQENLFLPFPGFSAETNFGAELVFDDALVREIPERQLRKLATADVKAAIAEGAGLYADAARSLAESGRCRVILCARPDEIREHDHEPEPGDGEDNDTDDDDRHDGEIGRDFHDLLKAEALGLACPLQIMRRETWEGTRRDSDHPRPLQDEATRAWNLHTALYYKAGGTPWRMSRHSSDLSTCYVGVSFYRTVDGEELHTAVAQVFNERGDGVVVRGGTAKISKADRRPHLTETDARKLLDDALAEYRRTHGHQPARIVLHKTSQFNSQEVNGFQGAADDWRHRLPRTDLDSAPHRAAPVPYRAAPALAGHERPARSAQPPALHARLDPLLPHLSRDVCSAAAAPPVARQCRVVKGLVGLSRTCCLAVC
jgi:hypothetical protein